MFVKPFGLLRPQKSGFIQEGKYTEAQLDDLINVQSYIPVVTASELTNLRTTISQTMGFGTQWETSYTTGLDKKYVQIGVINGGTFSKIENFTGIYDGNEAFVNDLTEPIFGVTQGTLKNIRALSNAITLTSNTSVICSQLDGGTIDNCQGFGTLANCNIGGFVVGRVLSGTITNIYGEGTIDGSSIGAAIGSVDTGTLTDIRGNITCTTAGTLVGGLIGAFLGGTLDKGHSVGTINGSANISYGGLIGRTGGGTVDNCYSSVAMNCATCSRVAGLIGECDTTTVSDCYSIGAISGNNFTGGLIGQNGASTYNECYWDTVTSGQAASAGGTGKTTTEMQNGSIPDVAIYIGWSALIWDPIDNSNYPILI